MPFYINSCKGDMNGVNQGRGCWWRNTAPGAHTCRFCGVPKSTAAPVRPIVAAPPLVPPTTAF